MKGKYTIIIVMLQDSNSVHNCHDRSILTERYNLIVIKIKSNGRTARKVKNNWITYGHDIDETNNI